MEFIPGQADTHAPRVYPKRSAGQEFFLILMIGALNTITPFSIDMYLPAFKRIAADLHTDMAQAMLTVSIYFLGFGIGQILYGPLLDRFGRKRPLYIGMVLYILASIGCATAPSIEMLLAMRFLQALSGCVASVAAMAMVLDFFPPERSSRIFSSLVLILGASPLLAPSVGGVIVDIAGWRYVFYVLSAITVLMLLMVMFFLPEGHESDSTVSLRPRHILSGFRDILSEPRFSIYALAGTFSFSGLFVYVAGSPGIFLGEFHVSPHYYSLIFAALSLGFIGSSQANHLLATRYSTETIFRTTLTVQVVASVLFFITVMSGMGTMPLVLTFLFIVLSCAGLTSPNASATALVPFTRNAGSASALLGFIQIGIGSLISAGVGAIQMQSTLLVSMIMAVSSGVALLMLLVSHRLFIKTS
ncbi:MAG: multidrug effflux MFS transporter [Bacteroidetes bacterium]|nr:multidrug effflux MFS transporter [Bacteroidota bacterium]